MRKQLQFFSDGMIIPSISQANTLQRVWKKISKGFLKDKLLSQPNIKEQSWVCTQNRVQHSCKTVVQNTVATKLVGLQPGNKGSSLQASLPVISTEHTWGSLPTEHTTTGHGLSCYLWPKAQQVTESYKNYQVLWNVFFKCPLPQTTLICPGQSQNQLAQLTTSDLFTSWFFLRKGTSSQHF